jgi:alkylated DNA repair dioxygenase AlkB
MKNLQNLLPSDGEVYYLPDFFNSNDSKFRLNELKSTIEWRHEPIKMFGKLVYQPRLTALYGDPNVPYSYSGISMNALPFTRILEDIKKKVEAETSCQFTHVLLNYYRNGQDSMGWHRDNEKSLGHHPVIASLSFGASRVFQLRNYLNKQQKINILLEEGSLLIMSGKSQNSWEHQLPKTNKVFLERINLTFRKLNV